MNQLTAIWIENGSGRYRLYEVRATITVRLTPASASNEKKKVEDQELQPLTAGMARRTEHLTVPCLIIAII